MDGRRTDGRNLKWIPYTPFTLVTRVIHRVTGWHPGDIPFTLIERAPGWISLVGSCAAEVRINMYMYVFMVQWRMHSKPARQSWAEKSENIQSGFGACIFISRALYCDVTMIDQISPGSLTAMPFTLRYHPGVYPGRLEGNISKKSSGILPGILPERPFTLRYHPGAPGWNLLSVKGVLVSLHLGGLNKNCRCAGSSLQVLAKNMVAMALLCPTNYTNVSCTSLHCTSGSSHLKSLISSATNLCK